MVPMKLIILCMHEKGRRLPAVAGRREACVVTLTNSQRNNDSDPAILSALLNPIPSRSTIPILLNLMFLTRRGRLLRADALKNSLLLRTHPRKGVSSSFHPKGPSKKEGNWRSLREVVLQCKVAYRGLSVI